MRTITLKLQLGRALTGRRTKPPIPDTELTALKEQAQRLLQQTTVTAPSSDTPNWADHTPAPAAPVPSPPPTRRLSTFAYGPAPDPDYVPEQPRIQAVSKNHPFGTLPTGEKRPEKLIGPKDMTFWDLAWERLTSAEKAWSSQP